MILKVHLLSPTAKLPIRSKPGDAGFDLSVDNQEGIIHHLNSHLIVTGVSIEIPEGYYGRVAPRSGLARKYNLDVLAGVVDSSYRGEILVQLINFGYEPFRYGPGDRIAQLIITKIETPQIEVVDYLSITERGAQGHGSTGTQ
jgi:dUTP pyrophosphatase